MQQPRRIAIRPTPSAAEAAAIEQALAQVLDARAREAQRTAAGWQRSALEDALAAERSTPPLPEGTV